MIVKLSTTILLLFILPSSLSQEYYDYPILEEIPTTEFPDPLSHDNVPHQFNNATEELMDVFNKTKDLFESIQTSLLKIPSGYGDVNQINTQAKYIFDSKVQRIQNKYESELEDIKSFENSNGIGIISTECFVLDGDHFYQLRRKYSNLLQSYLSVVSLDDKNSASEQLENLWQKLGNLYSDLSNARNISSLEQVWKKLQEFSLETNKDKLLEMDEKITLSAYRKKINNYAVKCFFQVYKESKEALERAQKCVNAYRMYQEMLASYKKKLMDDMLNQLDQHNV